MNIKEIKAKYEQAAQIVLKSMVAEEVKVDVGYDLEHDTMNVNIVNTTKGRSNEDIVVLYTAAYNNEKQTISIAAIARHVVNDGYGCANVMYEPVYVDEEFIGSLKQGLAVAIEHYEEILAQEEQKNSETEAEAEETTPTDDTTSEIAE